MSLKNKNEYQIGDKVITCGSAVYENVTETFVPVSSIGTIIKIRHRYENTINEHKQYKVKFDNYPDGDDVTNLYSYFKLKLY